MKSTVFISYSHKDEAWKDQVLDHLTPHVGTDRLSIWNDRQIAPGSEWFVEIEAAMNAASIAVCLISANYLQSTFCTQYEVAPLLTRRERHGLLLVPVLISPCGWDTVHWLKPMQMLPRDGKTLESDFAGREAAVLRELTAYIVAALKDPAHRPPPPGERPSAPERVDIDRLPFTGFELVGRDAELTRLNLAWRSFDTNIVCLTGWGGVGKSTLVNKWIERLEADGFEGSSTVFGWTFAGQPAHEQQGSAELFVHSALAWFNDPHPANGSPWDKGERLASLIAARRSLLVLDAIDSLQSSLAATRGRITDPALATLLVELAQRNPGLCVVTSRETVTDLAAFGSTVAQENLEQLSDQAGRAVLRLSGVRGPEAVLEAASRAVGGHALALRLLAPFLLAADGQVPERVRELLGDAGATDGKGIHRLLTAIEAELGAGAASEILHGLSVFGDGVHRDALRVVLGEPPVDGLNSAVHSLSDAKWQDAIRELRRRGVVSDENKTEPDRIVAHPVVCEHFAHQMRRNTSEAWWEANRRLAEHFASLAGPMPSTLEEAKPVLTAVYHAALSGRAEQAISFFHQRLDRNEQFWQNHLGAPGAVLSSLSAFFEADRWTPASELPTGPKGYLLNSTGTLLRALGRFEDAGALYSEALAVRKAEEDWQQASKNASNLAEVALVLGRIEHAVASAEESVAVAWRSDDVGQVIYCLTTLADAQHQAGKTAQAEATFKSAEQLHSSQIAARGHPIPVLYRMPGIRYGEFLLAIGELDRFISRAKFLANTGPDISDEESACGGVLVAEAVRLASLRGDPAYDFVDALRIANNSLLRLRVASSEIYLPRALLVRARVYSALRNSDAALRDVERALVVARRNNATLFAIDAQIERSRIELDRGNRDLAAKCLAEAKAQVEAVGYLRRARDIGDIEARL